MEDKDYATKKRPSRVTKKKVSYYEDSELEFDEDSYEQSKTKSFKKKVKATNSDSDSVEFKLGPEADTSDSDTFELGPKADTVLSEIESENEDPIVVVFDEKDATKPSTAAKSSAMSKSLTDKEKRATNKKIKEEVLQNIPLFKAELSVYNAFGPEHWKVLISQIKNVGNYTNQLFFGQSRVSQNWRAATLGKAQAKLEIGIIQVHVGGGALGETTAKIASSAIEVAKKATSTHTLHLSDDDAVNDVAVGLLVSTLVALRGGNTPIIPSAVDPYFAVGNRSKARNLIFREYDRAMMIMAKSYDNETAKKLAAELKEKHNLSANFLTFTEDSYKTPTQFTSANEIHRMCMLHKDDLHAEVRAFMDENCTNLMKNSTEYTMAFWQRSVVSILKSGSTMDDMVGLMVNGHGCVVPVIMNVCFEAKKGHAFFTMGTPAMLKKGWMARFICPGMSNNHHVSRNNNKHSVQYNANHLMSPTHCIIIDTGKLSNDNDGIYAGRAIMIGNESRIIRRVHESRKCNKRNELVRYDIRLSNHTYQHQHHQFMLIYATECGIGHTSYEYIFSKLRSTKARLNMTRESVNPDEHCDGDHCFHRLMLISNSIYCCFLMPSVYNENRH
jgi:hypothetical protein